MNRRRSLAVATRDLSPALWPQVVTLFGENGACGGCWCQAWRIEKGERWEDVKGAVAKRRLRKGILGGSVQAVLAFEGEVPIGWCTFGPRDSFPRLNRAPSLKCDDSNRVWSLPCFFVARRYRGKGVAKAMLAHALRSMKRQGAEIAEGYPSKPSRGGRYIAAFAWTGTLSLFEKAGFVAAYARDGAKRRMRKVLRERRAREGRP
jgi:GNAT superfamily N-acetyltransferase